MQNDTRTILTALGAMTLVILAALAALGYATVTQLSAHDGRVAQVVGEMRAGGK